MLKIIYKACGWKKLVNKLAGRGKGGYKDIVTHFMSCHKGWEIVTKLIITMFSSLPNRGMVGGGNELRSHQMEERVFGSNEDSVILCFVIKAENELKRWWVKEIS